MTTSKALVFDIKRFAVHDGFGIRTTVFFKGCPLRCKWCQNPEGLSIEREPIYFKNKCIHCYQCLKLSRHGQIDNKNGIIHIHNHHESFEEIVQACPANAITYDSQYYTIDELFKKIKADEVFFRDGGGVTFSGGEPFMQGPFLIEILKKCKAEKIHTALETSLYTSLDLIKEALPYLDLIYADLKVFDDDLHQQYTGVSVNRIKDNLSYILRSIHRDKVIVRTPLIPSMNATDENIKSISQFLIDLYPNVKYELLNYNPLASSKYELYNFTYGVSKQYKMFTQEKMQHFYNVVLQTGLKNLIIE
ncbi:MULTISPECIES: glycyl-radical enzyme activating protein [Coprobacillaceae]|uniref:glycyl-radical enzyme activating protein n=1 Tax=Coprobacillaceae TaxID=2810280 RepID=UPI000E53C832|nr:MULTISPECIES: glycyl-radical enzyme activating protein [Coprobacillaceae]RHM61720.1 glycyl-radical enzyme activating protein [Coprobacillus sp. AF33-1AC]RHS91716.1 glycyl-radical enzyme activating protein [Erysipelatoclostridium sp. AM42-17]